jgi:hypothetical protein
VNAGADDVPGGGGIPGIPDETRIPFVRGDCNYDDQVNHADAVMLYTYLFNPADKHAYEMVVLCPDAADANDDGKVDLADPTYIMMYLYAMGPQPDMPFPEAGQDPTFDYLLCYRPKQMRE